MFPRLPTAILALTVVLVGLSASVFFGLVPLVIGQAYRGESLPILNGIIRGQDVHPLEHYLRIWSRLATTLLATEGLLGVSLAVVSCRPIQRAVDRLLGPPRPSSSSRIGLPMRRREAVVANVAVVALVGLQILAIALQREDWPFSSYPMYSGQEVARFSWIRAYGVTPKGELRLEPERHLRPFDRARFHYSFERLGQSDRPAATERAVRALHGLYETGRRLGEHDGPPLHGLRLYREDWLIDASPANTRTPEHRRLIYELRLVD